MAIHLKLAYSERASNKKMPLLCRGISKLGAYGMYDIYTNPYAFGLLWVFS